NGARSVRRGRRCAMKKYLLISALAATMMTGCGVGVGYYAAVPPPPIRVETYGPAPGAGYIWTNGYWDYRGGNCASVGGRWQRPPRARAVWVEPRWEHRGGRYYMRRGYWR